MLRRLKGVIVPIITPLTEEDRVDTGSIERLVDHCIDGGLNGIYPCGTTGEMMYLSKDERKLVAEVTIKHTAGRVPVFVQVGAWNTRDTIELAEHAFRSGADGIGVVTPSFFKLSSRALIDFYVEVASSVPGDFPVYMYGIRQNAVNDIDPAICEEVSKRCSNVIGAKYSYSDMSMMQKLMLVKDETFSVLTGPDKFFHITWAAGGDGTVSGNSMCIPEHYRELYEALKNGDDVLARKLQRRTNLLNDIMGKVNNIAAYKSILRREGVISTSCMRKPMQSLIAEEEQILFRELDENRYREVIL